MIAEVAVSCAIFAIDQPYSYRVPENMELLPGMRVVVPFGRANRRTEAIVLAITTGSEETLKAICDAVDIPVVAIGGLNKSNILELSGTGVDGVALVSAIFSAENIESECRELRALSEKMVNA